MVKTPLLLFGLCVVGLAVEHDPIPEIKYPVELTKNVDDQGVIDTRAMYHRGWDWAWGIHISCPPNPGDNERNNSVIRYWAVGYMDGIKKGGNSDMPARYVRYLEIKRPALHPDAPATTNRLEAP